MHLHKKKIEATKIRQMYKGLQTTRKHKDTLKVFVITARLMGEDNVTLGLKS